MKTDPRNGLPQKLFYKVSSLTPLICVDLLIKDLKKGILLTWRSDKFYGPGWHIPGGIIRFKERLSDRIKTTSFNELKVNVKNISKNPIDVNEQINQERDIRGHFLALLFKCKIEKDPPIELKFDFKKKRNGTWKWHKKFPNKMIAQHFIYRKHFDL